MLLTLLILQNNTYRYVQIKAQQFKNFTVNITVLTLREEFQAVRIQIPKFSGDICKIVFTA